MRWCRATGQRPCWRNSAINRFRANVAAHYRYRKRCSSGLCTSNPARHRDRSGGGGSLHQPRCWSDMDHREPRTSRPSLLCRCFWEKRHFRVGIHRPFCDARRSLSTPDRRERSATAFGRRHAEKKQRGYAVFEFVDDRRWRTTCRGPLRRQNSSSIVARRQDQRAGYVRRRFQQRRRLQSVRSMKARIRFLLFRSIRHRRIVDRANARQQLRALFHVRRPPDCEPIDRRVLERPFSQ